MVSREVVLDSVQAEPVANHANWDVTPDGRFIFVEPVAGNRFLMVSDWAPRGETARR